MVAISLNEFDRLSTHLHTKKFENMRRRYSRPVKGKSTLIYEVFLKAFSSELIKLHIAGPNHDVELSLSKGSDSAFFQVIRTTNTPEEVLNILKRECSSLPKRISSDTGDKTFMRTTPGAYYGKRCSKGGRVTDALREAIRLKVFPSSLEKTMDWGFFIYKGQPKKLDPQ